MRRAWILLLLVPALCYPQRAKRAWTDTLKVDGPATVAGDTVVTKATGTTTYFPVFSAPHQIGNSTFYQNSTTGTLYFNQGKSLALSYGGYPSAYLQIGNADSLNRSTPLTNGFGMNILPVFGNNISGTIYGGYIQNEITAASTNKTNAVGLYINGANDFSSLLPNDYGLVIGNITSGKSLNTAFETHSGRVVLRDTSWIKYLYLGTEGTATNKAIGENDSTVKFITPTQFKTDSTAKSAIWYAAQFGVSTLNADNSPYIQAAIRAANPYTGTGGARIVFPPGHFDCASTIRLDSSIAVSLEGSGSRQYGTVLHFTGTGEAVSMSNANGVFLHANAIKNLAIQGNANCTNLFHARYAGDLLLENLDFSACTGKAILLTVGITARLNNVRTAYATPQMQYGFYADSATVPGYGSADQTTVLLDACNFQGASLAGIYLGNVQNIKMNTVTSERNGGWGVILSGDANLCEMNTSDIEVDTLGAVNCLGDQNIFTSNIYMGRVRIAGHYNTVDGGMVVNDTLVVTSGRLHNELKLVAHSGTGAIVDSSIHTVKDRPYNYTTGQLDAEANGALGALTLSTNKVAHKINLVHEALGTSSVPAGTNGIKAGAYEDKWYNSVRFLELNRGSTDGGSLVKIQTHPATWTDTEGSMVDALVLDQAGNATVAGRLSIATLVYYANRDSAKAHGLVVGDLFKSGTDSSTVKIVDK